MVEPKKTILIADDEEDLRMLVEITLEDARYHIMTAVDGQARVVPALAVSWQPLDELTWQEGKIHTRKVGTRGTKTGTKKWSAVSRNWATALATTWVSRCLTMIDPPCSVSDTPAACSADHSPY